MIRPRARFIARKVRADAHRLRALRGWAAGARRSASTKGAEAARARQATRQRQSSWLAHLDPVYLRNRVLYWLAANPPLDDVGSSDTDAAARAELLRAPPQRWDISQLPHQQSVASSAVEGLYVVRGFYNDEEVQAIRAAVHHITNGWSIQGQTEGVPFRRAGSENRLEWYEYHEGRLMLPMQPYPAVDTGIAERVLAGLQSTNGTDPHTWPQLRELIDADVSDDGNQVSRGARALVRLQQALQQGDIVPEAGGMPCMFFQVQHVERGGVVGSHVDPIVKGGKVISTAVINGANNIRVGDTIFRVEPGDVYGLAGFARYDVDHEVLSCVDDRLSITLRFGDNSQEAL